MSDLVTLSDNAVQQIQTLLTENDMEGYALRLAIRGGGCSGYSYQLEFVEGPEEASDDGEDLEYQHKGVRMILGPLKRSYLDGTVIDFEDTLMAAGFKINNPNAKRPCGCGESFDIDEGTGAAGASAY